MHLKQLELYGFKSFAEKTTLTFLPPKKGRHSVTAVVGPNGSGKSNISDAIRWVMGEQRMKTLRGKKGEDVIFSGSATKGKMGMASVMLVLDNSNHEAPIDAQDLVLTRRLYRSGESEYLVNGQSVRLLDVQLLLAKAQFAQGSYSVVGQGMIDKLLLQSPQERKGFFDEATGIKEFQIKRHQASLKLERTREHMAQAELLLNEVSPRLRSLSRQVKKLEQRHEVELSLREAQETYYASLFCEYEAQQARLGKELDEIAREFQTTNKELSAVQEELSALAKEGSRQDTFAALQEAFQNISRKKNALERDRTMMQSKLQTEYRNSGAGELGWIEEKLDTLKKEQEEAHTALERAEREVEDASRVLLCERDAVDAAQLARTELRGKLSQLQQQLSQEKSEQTFFQLSGLTAVQSVLAAREEFPGRIYGAVAQLARTPERFAVALDVAAGSHIASLVVEHDLVAEACIRFLRDKRIGTATFLPLNKIRPRIIPKDIEEHLGKSGVHGFAVDVLEYDNKFADVFSYIFGGTLIVDDIATAREIGIGRVRMVTLDGDILETSGSMKGGHRRRTHGGLSFAHQGTAEFSLARDYEKEVLRLQDELAKAERAYEEAQEALRSLQSRVQIAASRAELAGERSRALDSEIAGLTHERALSGMDPGAYDAAMKTLLTQKDALDADIASVEKEFQAIEQKMARFQDEEEQKKQRIFALQDAMQEIQKRLNAVVETKNEKEIALAKVEAKEEDLENDAFQELHAPLSSLTERGVPTVDIAALESLQETIQKLKYQLSLIGGIDEEVMEEYKETKEKHDALSTQLDDLHAAMEDLDTLIDELDETMRKKRAKAFAQIKKEFARYFSILFDGGKADLIEIYEDAADAPQAGEEDVAGAEGEGMGEDDEAPRRKKAGKKKLVLSGVDVSANPPGKKIENIQALSGGERTLVSIALVCAILHTNPAPFVVLDEVEAALDEANSLRFTKILRELSEQSQFVLITHNRATMHAADALYGVTMGTNGISQLVSVSMAQL